MVDGIRTESLRHEQAKLQLEQRNEREVKDLKEKQRNELERLIEHHAFVREDLEKAYDVAISAAKDEQEKKLAEVRSANDRQLEDEVARGEAEVEKVRGRYQDQIARYKQQSTKTLDELRRQHNDSAERIDRARNNGKA